LRAGVDIFAAADDGVAVQRRRFGWVFSNRLPVLRVGGTGILYLRLRRCKTLP